jgi:hypothetical protein
MGMKQIPFGWTTISLYTLWPTRLCVCVFHYVCTAMIINPLKEYGALNLVIYNPNLTPNLVLRLMLRTQKSVPGPRERPESRRFG